jgi:hypothetical protein
LSGAASFFATAGEIIPTTPGGQAAPVVDGAFVTLGLSIDVLSFSECRVKLTERTLSLSIDRHSL